LTLWVPDFLNPYSEETGATLLTEQLADFRQIHPDVQVQIIVKKAHGQGGLYNLLSTAVDAAPDVMPDAILLDPNDLDRAVKNQLVQPFDAALVPTTDFYAFSLTPWPDPDQSYGIPLTVQVDQTAYRQGIARTPPLTWTDVLTYGYSMLFPAAPLDGIASDALLSAYLSTGGATTDGDGQPTLDRAALERLYGFFAEMTERNLLNVDRVTTLPDTEACWAQYQQGVGRLTPVSAGVYWADPPSGSLPGWVPTPDGQPVTVAHVWSIALVTEDAFRQKAALDLMQWLTAPEQAAELTRAVRRLPPRRRAVELWGLLPEEVRFLDTLLDGAQPAPPPTVDEAVRRALQAGLSVLLQGEVDGPEAAATYALTQLRP
jgi:ABC-type glycerol-3-phosphate transport system substrate-binding protein